MTIYERIKALRIERGMSQSELAKKVGYEGRSAISKVENGERDISQSMIKKYADALGVTCIYLMYGDLNVVESEIKGGKYCSPVPQIDDIPFDTPDAEFEDDQSDRIGYLPEDLQDIITIYQSLDRRGQARLYAFACELEEKKGENT